MALYLKSILMDIKCEMEYKVSFVLLMLSSSFATLFTVLGIVILLNRFGSIDGWTINEIMLITGIAVFGHCITEMFGRGLDHFYKMIKSGSFDRLLVRPRTITLQVLSSDFQFSKIGRVVETILLLAYAICKVTIDWTLYKVFVLILMILGSCILFYSILLLKASLSFWTIEGMELMSILSDGGKEVASYPIGIYRKWFAIIFTYVVPFGCVNYFPILYLLDKEIVPWWYGLTPFVTIVFLGICFGIWRLGISQYKSTGS